MKYDEQTYSGPDCVQGTLVGIKARSRQGLLVTVGAQNKIRRTSIVTGAQNLPDGDEETRRPMCGPKHGSSADNRPIHRQDSASCRPRSNRIYRNTVRSESVHCVQWVRHTNPSKMPTRKQLKYESWLWATTAFNITP